MRDKRGTQRPTAGRRIVGALHEALAIQRGHSAPVRQTRRLVTARAASAEPAPHYSAGQVRRLRSRLALSQTVFAQLLNVSAETVRSWEQGKNPPSGPAARLLQLTVQHPEWMLKSIEAR